MCKKYGIKIALFLLLFLGTGFGQDIRVENVFVPQDSIERYSIHSAGGLSYVYKGFAYYDLLYEGDQDTFAVNGEISIDSGISWQRDNIVFSGDFGRVVKGQNKEVIWNWYGEKLLLMLLGDGDVENAFIKIIVNDSLSECGYEPPQPPVFAGSVKGTKGPDSSQRFIVNWFSSDNPKILGYDIYFDKYLVYQEEYDWIKLNEDPVVDTTFIYVPSETIFYATGSLLPFKLVAIDSCVQESIGSIGYYNSPISQTLIQPQE